MPNKYNPFRPDKIVPPGMFCGRVAEIEVIDQCLIQTRAANPQHFLIEGERGIGKSSLFFLEAAVAHGKIKTISNESVLFLTLNVVLEAGDNYYSIIKKISSELQRAARSQDKLKDITLKTWELISRIEAAGIKIKAPNVDIDEHKLLTHMQDDFVSVISSLTSEDGILLLIDEADQPGSEGNLGRLCKLLTEHLTRSQCDRLCIGLAGLPGLISTLRDSHESSPRLFRTMNLMPLEDDECKRVIDFGLKDAEKNGVTVTATDEAKQFIARACEGYPHFLQEFSYCSYEIDTDNKIDLPDVTQSLFGENGVFEQLGRKYFNKYYNSPDSDDYRRVLDTMALHSESWVDRATIIRESNIKASIVDNALRALKNRQTIIQNEQLRGEYKLPTRAFAVWIKVRGLAEKSQAEHSKEPTFFKE